MEELSAPRKWSNSWQVGSYHVAEMTDRKGNHPPRQFSTGFITKVYFFWFSYSRERINKRSFLELTDVFGENSCERMKIWGTYRLSTKHALGNSGSIPDMPPQTYARCSLIVSRV
jgi:hypothetical protein